MTVHHTASLRLSNILLARSKSLFETQGLETGPSDALENDVESVFSGFTSDEGDTESVPEIFKADSQFSEQRFFIKTILGQLVKISTAIRRSGAKFRYKKADESLKEDEFTDFKDYLKAVILTGATTIESEQQRDVNELCRRITDTSQLTVVQQRLIHGNVLRMNRILFATRSAQSKKKIVKSQQSNPTLEPTKFLSLERSESVGTPQFDQQAKQPASVLAPASSIIAPSITRTATEIGSNIDLRHVSGHERPSSVITKVTRTGATLDYPSCPPLNSEELLLCPYCEDILPADYSKNTNRWRHEYPA